MNVHLRKCVVLLLSLMLIMVMGLGIAVSGAENASIQESVQYGARVLGDVDENQIVDVEDVLQLLLHVSMPEAFPVDVNADYNGDDTVDVNDAFRLLLYVSMPDRFPLYGEEESVIAYCEHCEQDVEWGIFSAENAATTGHWRLVGDVNLSQTLRIGTSTERDVDTIIDLNGKSLQVTSGDALGVWGTLSIVDTVGGGKVTGSETGRAVCVYSSGTFNLYNGTLTVCADDIEGLNGGVVCVNTDATFNMYGGKLTGGTAIAKLNENNKYSGGIGGNLYIAASGTANIYEGEISGGKAVAAVYESVNPETNEVRDAFSGGVGGNIYCLGKLNIGTTDGTFAAVVKGGEAHSGGNLYIASVGTANIYAGEISGGTVKKYVPEDFDSATGNVSTTAHGGLGGNIVNYGDLRIGTQKGVLTAVVENGVANMGGNIYTLGEADTLIEKTGIVRSGKAIPAYAEDFGCGGNIYLAGDGQTLTIKGEVSDGAADRGGNIGTVGATILVDGGKVLRGSARNNYGGNIYISDGVLHIINGALIADGVTTTTRGSNIYAAKADIKITESTVSDGNVIANAVNLTLGDGAAVTNGELRLNSTCLDVNISGTVKVDHLNVACKINVGELGEGTIIGVSAPAGAFTNPIADGKAAEYVQYFKDYSGERPIFVQDDALCIGTLTYCAHCDQSVLWDVFDPNVKAYSGAAHLIVNSDVELVSQLMIGSSSNYDADVVIDLNGHTITTGIGGNRFAVVYAGLSILDNSKEQSGMIIAAKGNPTRNGNVIMTMPNSTVNLYSGTLTVAEGVVGARGGILYVGNVFNMYGGKIVGGTVQDSDGGNIYGTANSGIYIFGGEILNGTAIPKVTVTPAEGETAATTTYESGLGGNIYTRGKLDIAGGGIFAGKAYNGGNILSAGDVIVQENAEISDGEATERGGNIMMITGNKTLTVSGKVFNGVAPVAGNIFTVDNLALVVDGGEIVGGSFRLGDGTFTVSGAARIDNLTLASGQKLTLGELTEGAAIKIAGAAEDMVFTNPIADGKAAEYANYFAGLNGAVVVEGDCLKLIAE